jgi:hypothetical protein
MLKKTKIIDMPIEMYALLNKKYNYYHYNQNYKICLCQYHFDSLELSKYNDVEVVKVGPYINKKCDNVFCPDKAYFSIIFHYSV